MPPNGTDSKARVCQVVAGVMPIEGSYRQLSGTPTGFLGRGSKNGLEPRDLEKPGSATVIILLWAPAGDVELDKVICTAEHSAANDNLPS
jgi:hypothetical protein